MLPDWLEKSDNYIPTEENDRFITATLKKIGQALSRIKIQKGHEKEKTLPPLLKLCLTIGGILLVSLSQNRLVIMVYIAIILSYLCTWPPIDIRNILKSGLLAMGVSLIILLPAMLINNSLIRNNLFIVLKVFISVVTLSIFNHTTQWNHVTKALRQLHIPGIFIFTLDISLKYIVLLGNLINDLLTALELRSVGKNKGKYASIGGVMGVTFLRGTRMSSEMYEAMICRGFTDDYEGLSVPANTTEDKQ